jgi:uncharacterized membrane protein YbaN (DUF454 family)
LTAVPAARVALSLVGLTATGVGFAGIWLPGVPTTPFLLVALWAFGRSSPRLHRWLCSVPLLSAALEEARRFERERVVRRSVKITAFCAAWGSLGIAAAAGGGSNPLLLGALAAAAVSCTLFMWYVPTAPRSR